ncbi:MAG: XdhC family protein [Cetobacterium sp.]
MDLTILEKIFEIVKINKSVALVTLTKSKGSTPRKEGSLMAVWDTSFVGSIGGGMVEHRVIEIAREALEKKLNMDFKYDLLKDAEVGMSCGGSVEGYIKIVNPKNRIVIVGAGHIGQKLYSIIESSDFEKIIIDDRVECKKIIPDVLIGNYSETIKKLSENENTYFIIVTRGHSTDEESLTAILDKKSKYIGMIGSKKKVIEIKNKIKEQGKKIPEKKLYSPIGLKISDGSPFEIAIEIMAEILKIKNEGELIHRRIKDANTF